MTAPIDQKRFIDPVCGMQVDPDTAAAQTCYNGITRYRTLNTKHQTLSSQHT